MGEAAERERLMGGPNFPPAGGGLLSTLTLPLVFGVSVAPAVYRFVDGAGRDVAIHTVLESVSTVIGFCTFVVAWQARHVLADGCLVFLGIAFFYTALLDDLHLLSHAGLAVFPADHGELSTGFRTAARLNQSLSLLMAIGLSAWCRIRPLPAFAVYGFGTGLVAWAILDGRILPAWTDLDGQPSTFASQCMDLSSLGLVAVLAVLFFRRHQFDPRIAWFLAVSCLFQIASQAVLADGWQSGGTGDVLGHGLKAAAFWCVLRGIVETALVQPLALVAGSLARERGLAAAIERQERRLRAVLAAAPDPHLVFDRAWRCAYANPAAAALPPPGTPGWPFGPWLDAALAGSEPVLGETELAGRHYEYRAVPMPDFADDANGAVLVVLRDVTERVAGERRLHRAVQDTERARRLAEAADQAKSRFLVTASHDLRQPLQATRLFLELLERSLERPDHQDHLKRAQEALSGGEEILSSLLELAPHNPDERRVDIAPVPLQPLFLRLADEFAPQARAKGLRLRAVPSPAVAASEPVMLARILRNLLTNAVRYTDRGGILLGCRRQSGNLVILVVDTGCGIGENEQELIFQEFYRVGQRPRSRSDGLGLGLAIVRRKADLLGHTIELRSHPGRGSAFALRVARWPSGPASADTGAAVDST